VMSIASSAPAANMVDIDPLDTPQASLSRSEPVCSLEADDAEEEGRSESPKQSSATRPPRLTSSKYDFVKVISGPVLVQLL
jgi:hypothetical protein